MNNAPELLSELIEAYEKKLAEVDKATVQQLKDNFQLFHSIYRAIYEMFLQKGVLKSDPYKNDRRLSDIYAPEDVMMNDSELEDQLPIKLSEYDNLLDFLVNYTQFKAASLSLKKIKILSAIIRYVDWNKLTATSTHPITRGVALCADKVKGGTDQIAVVSIQSNHNKMDQLAKALMKDLKALADFKREEYKLFIRQRILPQLEGAAADPGKEQLVKLVKSHFARAMEGEAFFPEIVGELHDEVFAADAELTHRAVLSRFQVAEVKKKVEKQAAFNLRDILFDGVKSLGTASRHLDEALFKLKENAELLRNRPRGLMERFKDWITSLSQGKEAKREIYEVELVDINTTMKRLERIEFNEFSTMVAKRSRFFTSLLVKTSPAYAKLEAGDDQAIYDFLEKSLGELKQLHERLDALDTYFKSESPATERSKMKGIKVELGNLKNSIALVNQKIHEYVARKEEQEQLRRLGLQSGD